MLKDNNIIKKIKLMPIAFIFFFIPIIVFMKHVNLTGDYFKYWNGLSDSYDFFAYYKSMTLVMLTGCVIFIFIYDLITKRIKIKKMSVYIPIGIYTVMMVISSVFSDYKEITLLGFVERYEGMVVLLCYIAILFIAIQYLDNEDSIKFVLGALMISATIISIIGIFQYLGLDFFQTAIGKNLMLPKEYHEYAEAFGSKFGKNTIYSTLYHYNYVGSYMAMMFPFTLILAAYAKKNLNKILFGIITLLLFLNWFGSNSRAGIVGGVLAIIAILIIMRKALIERWKITLGAVLIMMMLAVGLNIASDGMIFNRVKTIIGNITGRTTDAGGYKYKDIRYEDNTLILIDNKGELKISSKGNEVILKDENDKTLNPVLNENYMYVFNDERYSDYQISKFKYDLNGKDTIVLNIVKLGTEFNVLLDGEDVKYLTPIFEVLDINQAERLGFYGKEKMGSARGYIWSRSLPLLKDAMILGYGPDTFAAKFPQDDYLGKLVAYDTTQMLVDKPHNMYLQIALSSGVISLIAFLAILVMYFVGCFKSLFGRDRNDILVVVGIGIFVGIIGYLGAGFFNDSVVAVAPVFWALLGTGIGINYKLNLK